MRVDLIRFAGRVVDHNDRGMAGVAVLAAALATRPVVVRHRVELAEFETGADLPDMARGRIAARRALAHRPRR